MKITKESATLSYDHYNKPIEISLITFDSLIAGPSVFIQSSVHGAELQGNLVIDELMQLLKQYKWCGKVTFVPFANPWSAQNNLGGYTFGRFDPVSGENWNRNYHDLSKLIDKASIENFIKKTLKTQKISKDNINTENLKTCSEKFKEFLVETLIADVECKESYGLSRAKKLTFELQKRSSTYDIFLDLHTAPRAGLYLYAPNSLKNSAKNFLFQTTLLIPEEFAGAGDEAHFCPWAQLRKYFNSLQIKYDIPVESYTLELGGEELVSVQSAQDQAARIVHYLYSKEVFLEELPQNNALKNTTELYYGDLESFKTYYSPRTCLCNYDTLPGAKVEKDQVLAILKYWNPEQKKFAQEELKSHSPSIVVNQLSTSNLAMGSEVLQLLENPIKY